MNTEIWKRLRIFCWRFFCVILQPVWPKKGLGYRFWAIGYCILTANNRYKILFLEIYTQKWA
jgi:hypothetical protein